MSHPADTFVGVKKNQPVIELAQEIDDCLAQPDHVEALQRYEGEWISNTRAALGWVTAELAIKLGVTQQSISRLEARERNASISIAKLKDVAEAMDCRLVYGFIPNDALAASAIDLRNRQAEARRKHQRMPRPA